MKLSELTTQITLHIELIKVPVPNSVALHFLPILNKSKTNFKYFLEECSCFVAYSTRSMIR